MQDLRNKVEQLVDTLEKQQTVIADQEENVNKALRVARLITFHYERDKAKLGGSTDQGEVEEDANRDPTEEDLEGVGYYETDKDSKHYKAKVNAKQKRIEAERSKRSITEVDPAVAREKYLRAKKDLDSKMEQINAIDEITKSLEIDLKERKKRWRQFRSHIAQMTNISFDEFLNKKGASGEIEFD